MTGNWRELSQRYAVDLPGGWGLAAGPATGQRQRQIAVGLRLRAERAERERDALAVKLAELEAGNE